LFILHKGAVMVSKSIAILLVGAALGTGLEHVRAPNRASVSVDTSSATPSPNLHRESIVAVTAEAESAGEESSPENYIVGCVGGADPTGNDCM
jgi:hypothetical protein